MKKLMFASVALLGLTSISFAADTLILVDKEAQVLLVNSDYGSYEFPVSTAASGFTTPSGVYHPQRLEEMHYSKKYHNSPMGHSIFYSGGYAIHATNAVYSLGRPASHGCVRLSPRNAALLYEIVQNSSGTTIVIK